MRVNLAAQVLSETSGNVLNNFGNVRNTKEHITKRKPFLKPYESIDDIRFVWLDEFLNYFKLWKD